MLTRRECPACGGGFLLNAGVARCPHCNRCVSAGAGTSSSLRASDRKGWRFLGQHSGSSGRQDAPFVVKGQEPDHKIRAMQDKQLAEKRVYWAAEIAEIESQFGPLPPTVKERLGG